MTLSLMPIFKKIIIKVAFRIALMRITQRFGIFIFSKKMKVSKYNNKVKDAKPRIMFGTSPILNNSYWSRNLEKIGYYSQSVMTNYFTINKREDFDLYTNDIIEENANRFSILINFLWPDLKLLFFIIERFDIIITSVNGIYRPKFISITLFNDLILKFGIKVIVIPYGSDYQIYSQILNPSFRVGLNVNYPKGAKFEKDIKISLDYWVKNSHCFIPAFQIDGIGRMDLLPFSTVSIDIEKWPYSLNIKGKTFNILHTPNHRGIKGTEFLLKAVSNMKSSGMDVNLILIEGKPNSLVQQIMENEADILVEQLIIGGYGLSAIEGMSKGLVVISNLEEEIYTRIFRRYSFLNECPILSATPESIEKILTTLYFNRNIIKELGNAGRQYVEKYHSDKSSNYMFERIFESIWFNQKVDLMEMYHPLNPNSYNNQSPIIEHPLVENKIPESLMKTLRTE